MISLHPKLAAVMDGVVGLVLMLALPKMSSWWLVFFWFSARALWWIVLVQFMYYPPLISRVKHFLSLILFNAGILFLLIFVDWPGGWNMAAAIFIVLPLASFWQVPERADELTVLTKPHRRILFLLVAMSIAGLWSGVEALAVFQVIRGLTLGLVAATAVAAVTLMSGWWWKEYGVAWSAKFFYCLIALGLILLELTGVMLVWPLGYLVSSFLLTWLWYLVWMLFRFYLTPEGIDWRSQRWFLLFNFVLLVLFLGVIVRWK